MTRYYNAMTNTRSTPKNLTEIRDLIDRLSRISAAEHWVDDLNPAQLAALSYLAKANQHSRAPSQVAEYLSAMRGTVSVTLKALVRKGLIEEQKSQIDRRRTSYTATQSGLAALNFETSIDAALAETGKKEAAALAMSLKSFVKRILKSRGDRSFGICSSCRHHRKENKKTAGAHCALLNVSLTPPEVKQICFEHQTAA